MKTICRMLKRDSKGFTLVELMVVLLIIGILVAIAIPIYNKTQENAEKKACQSNLRTIDGAVAQYCAANDLDPSTINIDKLDDNSVLVQQSSYLKKAPKCGGKYYKVVNGEAQCTNDSANHTY